MFGKVLKELRTDKNLKQTDIAAVVGVDYRTVGNWENERSEPDIATLIKLAHFFEVSVGYLVGDETD